MPPGGGGGGEQVHPLATDHGGRGEEAMAPGGGGEQVHPLAIDHGGRGEDAPSLHSPPPPVLPGLPVASEKKQQQKHGMEEQPAARLPGDALMESEKKKQKHGQEEEEPAAILPGDALCSDPAIRGSSPQTLFGFFHHNRTLSFRNSSGGGPPLVDPSLPSLRRVYENFSIEQCSSSLLLCQCWVNFSKRDEYDYVVCNPATGKWAVLPPLEMPDHIIWDIKPIEYFLGFDPAVPSSFVVFVPLGNCYGEFNMVAIYSPETGGWTYMQSGWHYKTVLVGNSESVYLNGTMHLNTHYSSIVTVDMEGKAWREIEMPEDMVKHCDLASIGHSQGRLYVWYIDNRNDCQLSIWVLEDYDSGKWTLKHTVDVPELFRRHDDSDMSYTMFAIHPNRNLIFLTDDEEKTLSYDLDSRAVDVISTSEEFLDGLLYIPCFAEWASDGH